MAEPRKFLTEIDMGGLEILNQRIQNLATVPAPADGRIFFHTGSGRIGVASGGSWQYLALMNDGVVIENLDSVPDSSTRLAMTPGERTKLANLLADATKNQTDAYLLARANHTGTQSADTIVDGTNNKVFTAADHSKIDGIAAGATANSTDAALRARASHTGTQSADTIVDGTTNKAYTATEQAKLAAVTPGATVNATDAQLRDRSTHTGTQARSTISDFVAGVRAEALSSLAVPTAPVSMNNQRLTNVGTPTATSDGVTKGYVDALIQGLDLLPSVRAATTANLAALSGLQTVDGVALTAGQRVLVKNQTTASANGVYVVASGAWTRGVNSDSSADLTPGAFVFVEEGTVNDNTGWVLATNGAIVVGTTAQQWVQFSGAGSTEAGNGLTRNGNVLTVGAGTGITVSATAVGINTAVVVRKYAVTLATVAALHTVTHNLGTVDVQVAVRDVATGELVEADVRTTGVNTLTVGFAVAPAANAYRVTVFG